MRTQSEACRRTGTKPRSFDPGRREPAGAGSPKKYLAEPRWVMRRARRPVARVVSSRVAGKEPRMGTHRVPDRMATSTLREGGRKTSS